MGRRQALRWMSAATAAVVLGAVLIAGAVSPTQAATHRQASTTSFVGAGSTFDLPFFKAAFKAYGQSHHVSVNYQGLGSGAGIKQYTANTIAFGASDVPMNSSELELANRTGSPTVQIPVPLS